MANEDKEQQRQSAFRAMHEIGYWCLTDEERKLIDGEENV